MTKYHMFEERFGFKREIFSMSEEGGTLEILPSEPHDVLIHFEINGETSPVTLQGNLITSAIPAPSIEEARFLIKSEGITFDIKEAGKCNIKIGKFDDLRLTCKTWFKIYKIFDGASRFGFSFKVTNLDMEPFFSGNIQENPDISEETKNSNKWVLKHWSYLRDILSRCGGDTLKFSLDEMGSASDQIRDCYTCLFTPNAKISLSIDSNIIESHLDNLNEIQGYFGNGFKVGEFTVAYVCKMIAKFSSIDGKHSLHGTLIEDNVAELINELKYDAFLKKVIDALPNEIVCALPIDKDQLPPPVKLRK